jgi:pyrimidine operon attenuation protein/uracil phosphoribosyltransferase
MCSTQGALCVLCSMNCLISGQPASVKLAVLVDRGGQHPPVQADFAAARVALPASQSLALAKTQAGEFDFSVKKLRAAPCSTNATLNSTKTAS